MILVNINNNYPLYFNNYKTLSRHSAYNTNPSNNTTFANTPPSFTGINAVSEKGFQKCEYALRIIGNRIADLFEGKKVKQITKDIAQITPQSNEKYLKQLDEISRFYSSDKTIDVNIEDNILERIANSGQSAIFIMNHSNQKEDPSMLAVLNTLLTNAYKSAGRHDNFPLPKIILNQDILKTMNATKRKAFEAFGAVGIDANIYSADKQLNARVFLPLIKDFVRNKSNIFIFPEGKLAIRKDLDFDSRFQIGIAELINKVLGIKKEVSVVPVGFSYGKGESKLLNGMHIGEPVKFTRHGENTTTTSGIVLDSEFARDDLKKFFQKHKNEQNITITENGVPVKPAEVSDFIKSILAENLNICSKEAQKKIRRIIDQSETVIY